MASCQFDGGTKGVETVTVTFGGTTYVVDLCDNEIQLLRQWVEGADKPSGRERAKPPTHSVTPID